MTCYVQIPSVSEMFAIRLHKFKREIYLAGEVFLLDILDTISISSGSAFQV